MKTKDFIQQEWVKKEIKSRVNYNPDTGELTWAERGVPYFDRLYAGKTIGHSWVGKNGYTYYTAKVEFKGRKITLACSRLAWLIYTGDWPEHTIDHIDRNSLNNKWENLRDVTQAENNYNKDVYKSNKTGFKGVNKKAGRYWARITHNKITYRLGYHDTPEDAAQAYDKKARELLGDKAILNFPEENP